MAASGAEDDEDTEVHQKQLRELKSIFFFCFLFYFCKKNAKRQTCNGLVFEKKDILFHSHFPKLILLFQHAKN